MLIMLIMLIMLVTLIMLKILTVFIILFIFIILIILIMLIILQYNSYNSSIPSFRGVDFFASKKVPTFETTSAAGCRQVAQRQSCKNYRKTGSHCMKHS